MSNLKSNIRTEVLKTLDNLKLDVSSVRSKISFGNPVNEQVALEDFNLEHLNANHVYEMTNQIQDEVNRLKMLLNLLK